MQRLILILPIVLLFAPPPAALGKAKTEPPETVNLDELTPNRWTRLPGGDVNGYAQPTYHPADKTLVAPLYRGNGTAHLDPKAGKWAEALSPAKASRGGDCPLMKHYKLREDGRPNYSNMCLFHMVTYDSKRERIIAGAAGFFAAYDPKTKTWTDLKAEVELAGKKYPGVPPVAWGAMCYDPVNDEIVMLPGGAGFDWTHWKKDKEVTGTFGTFIYDCGKNIWQRPQIGPPEFYKARALLRPVRIKLQDLMSRAGEAIVLSREGKDDQAKKLLKSLGPEFRAVGRDIDGFLDRLPDLGTHPRLKAARDHVLTAGRWENLLDEPDRSPERRYRRLFSAYRDTIVALDEYLWSHPHPRYHSRMVYLPEQKAILMWGGTDGHQHLNDTWLYDCTKREWIRKSPKTLPRPREMHVLVYSSKLGKAVMAGGYTNWWAYPKDELREVWTYGPADDDWRLVLEDFPFQRGRPSYYGEYDPEHDAIVVVGHGTWALKLTQTEPLKAPKTTARPVPEDREPFVPPKDDPKVIERWKNLPANKWTKANANRRAHSHGWGMMGWNGRLQCTIAWGGGHSTHQANEIDLYFPGANKWVRGYPAHRINIAPWNKGCGNPGGVDHRGGVHNLHARNGLAGNGGKMVITMQAFSPYYYGPPAWHKQPTRWGRTTTFEYDLFSRRWQMPCPPTIPGGMCYPYNAKKTVMSVQQGGAWYYDFDKQNWAAAASKKCPAAVHTGEGAGRLFIEPKNLAVMIGPVKGKTGVQTWALDIAKNQWSRLANTSSPPGVRPTALAYVDRGEGYIFAGCFLGWDKALRGSEAVYSFGHDRWMPLGTKARSYHSAWGKIAYSPKHSLLIRGEAPVVMRPDFAALDWEK